MTFNSLIKTICIVLAAELFPGGCVTKAIFRYKSDC